MKSLFTNFALSLLFMAISIAAENSKPNIIFILADDLGQGDLGCYGQKVILTPNLDKMANEGLKFNRHYSGSTVCAPSRSCLLTGNHTGHITVRGNGSYEMAKDPQDITIARLLKNGGYKTALIGKSGVACNSESGQLVNDKGFDYFFGYTSHQEAHFYFPEKLYRNNEMIEFPNNKLHTGDNYSTDLIMEESLKFIEANKATPFFLHLSLQMPHASLYAKEKYKALYRNKVTEPKFEEPKRIHYTLEPEPKATYAGMVTALDEQVGVVLNKLKELGIDKNTLVIFSSDNGPMNEGGYKMEYFDSNGILRGGKRDLYEGGIRVPTIAWWQGTIQPGRVTEHISAHWDFLPTALDLAGLPAKNDIDGISYKNELLGLEQKQHEYLYWEFHEGGGKQAVIWNGFKGVRLDVQKKANQPIELYHLQNDPQEEKNIASENPEIVAKIKEIMKKARVPHKDFPFAEDAQ